MFPLLLNPSLNLCAVIPKLSRQIDPLHHIPLAQHCRTPNWFFPPNSLHPRVVYWSVPPFPRCNSLLLSLESFFQTSAINLISIAQHIVCYSLGIYLLNLFLAFLQPKFDPSLTQDEGLEDGQSSLPTKQDEEFRPFIRRLPEFKFWHSATRAIAISFLCTWFSVFNVPVFWPVLVVYFIILFSLTSKYSPTPFLPN